MSETLPAGSTESSSRVPKLVLLGVPTEHRKEFADARDPASAHPRGRGPHRAHPRDRGEGAGAAGRRRRARRRLPREVFTDAGRAGLLGLPVSRRSTAAAASRTRSTSRCWRRSARRGRASASASACTRCRASRCSPSGPTSSARAGCPDMLGGRAARRVLPVGGARGVRPGGDARQGRPRRRRLRAQRRQGVDHPRRRGRLLHRHGPHLGRRPARHLLLPRARRHARAGVRHARGQDGPDGLHHRDRPAGRRPDPARPPDRRRGPGPVDRACGARRGPARHRRGRHRPRAGRPRRRRRLRQGARGVRQADHRAPGPGVPARRHGRRGRVGARDVPASGAAEGRGPPVRPRRRRSPSSSPPTPR